jgi:hypothetical protein
MFESIFEKRKLQETNMKNTNKNPQSCHDSSAGIFTTTSRRLALAALLVCGLAFSTSAQEAGRYKTAVEKGLTVVPNVPTPIVLKTMPDAACDLHVEYAGQPDHQLRIYANGDGYVKIHVTAKQQSEDGIHAQLDCRVNGKAVRYPLHLRASSSPTAAMPAPRTVMPAPKGSKVMPALSQQEAQQLSDEELIDRGFPPRPDASTSPDAYAKWVDLVSQPITMVTPHLVARTEIAPSAPAQGIPQQQGIQYGATSSNWSGYVDFGSYRGFTAVYGQWNVPTIVACESNTTTYSGFWVGLDGYSTSDLVQDGTSQTCTDFGGIFNFLSYSAWEEVVPNQPYSQNVSISPNPGDSFWAEAWVGDAYHNYNPNGGYAWFNMWDTTQRQGVLVSVPLGSTKFNGNTAEWIMERPTVGGQQAQLSDYLIAPMTYPEVMSSSFNWYYYNNFSNMPISMYNGYLSGNDNNLLSTAIGLGPTLINFFWENYH